MSQDEGLEARGLRARAKRLDRDVERNNEDFERARHKEAQLTEALQGLKVAHEAIQSIRGISNDAIVSSDVEISSLIEQITKERDAVREDKNTSAGYLLDTQRHQIPENDQAIAQHYEAHKEEYQEQAVIDAREKAGYETSFGSTNDQQSE